MMVLLRLLAGLALIAVTLLRAAPVLAHCPVYVDRSISANDPVVLPGIVDFVAYHARLGSATDVHYFTFDGVAGQRLSFQIVIPQDPGLEGFAPSVALAGPELMPAAPPERITLSSGAGLVQFEPLDPPGYSRDEDGTVYWLRLSKTLLLPADGPYAIIVWSPSGETGAYGLAVGIREVPCEPSGSGNGSAASGGDAATASRIAEPQRGQATTSSARGLLDGSFTRNTAIVCGLLLGAIVICGATTGYRRRTRSSRSTGEH